MNTALRRLLLGAAIATVGIATLIPLSGPGAGGPTLCLLFCGPRGAADNLANVLLFLPLGFALALNGFGVRRAALLGMAGSLVVEAAQLSIVTGRDANPADVISNAAGAALGAWLALTLPRLLAPATERLRRRLLIGAATLTITTVGLTGYLLSPWFPEADYYGQWNDFRGSYQAYSGTVLAASVGWAPIPQAGVAPATLRESLLEGASFRVLLLAGPRMDWQAQIARIGDGPHDVIFLGAYGDDLVLHYRSRSAALRLDQPTVRLPRGLEGFAPGDRLVVQAWRQGAGYCLGNGERYACAPLSTGGAWQLVQSSDSYGMGVRRAAGALVLALLWLPLGAWTRRDRFSVAVVALTALALPLTSRAAGLGAIPPVEVMGIVAGFLAGVWLSRWTARRDANPRVVPDPDAPDGQSDPSPAAARISASVS